MAEPDKDEAASGGDEIAELRQQAQMTFEFARFGFAGTLGGASGGMILIFALACLQAFTSFKMETYGYVLITACISICVVAYGFFSHRSMPEIVAKSGKKSFTIRPSTQRTVSATTRKTSPRTMKNRTDATRAPVQKSTDITEPPPV